MSEATTTASLAHNLQQQACHTVAVANADEAIHRQLKRCPRLRREREGERESARDLRREDDATAILQNVKLRNFAQHMAIIATHTSYLQKV